MKILKLEAIRGFAAIYVVIHHLILFTSIYSQTPSAIKFMFRFGREAVLIFFLLSGFVICIAVKKNNNKSFYSYFIKRFLRIYPILIITCLISVLIFIVNGNNLSIDVAKSFFANMLQFQRVDDEPGSKIPTFLGNLPLWSLSYEWWFYMLFFPLYYLISKYKNRIRSRHIYFILMLSAVSWLYFVHAPDHLFLILTCFLLWWTGFYCGEIYLEKGNFTFKDMLPVYISLGVMSLIMGGPIAKDIFINHKKISEINSQYPLTLYFYNYLEALILLVVALIWWHMRMAGFNLILGWFAKLAPISYAIYVIHFPIIQLNMPFISNIYLLLFVKLCLMLVISYFLEINFQPWVLKQYRFLENRWFKNA